jgi:acyl-CoA hydrolase
LKVRIKHNPPQIMLPTGAESLNESGKTPSQSATTMVRIMMPMDANVAGNVFGGSILRLIDEVASIVAFKHARSNVVTASIDRMDFYSPVYIGDLLRLIASINYVHKTSMEIGVRVEAENPITGEVRHTGTCFLTYVALDQARKPTSVPALVTETEEEKRRWVEAEVRRNLRLQQIK